MNSTPNTDTDDEKSGQSENFNDRFAWSANNYGEIENLEVPWDVDYINGTGTVMPPPDYSLAIAVIVTILVMIFFLLIGALAFKRNHKDIRIFGDIIRLRSRKYFKENDKKSNSEYNNEVDETTIEENELKENDGSHEIAIEITEHEDNEIKTANKKFDIIKLFKKQKNSRNDK